MAAVPDTTIIAARTGCDMEIAVHRVVLLCVLVPLYVFACQFYFIQVGVWAGLSAGERVLAAISNRTAEPELIDPDLLDAISACVAFLLLALLSFFYRQERRLRSSPAGGRRYRPIPSQLAQKFDAAFDALWRDAAPNRPRPRLYCFGASPVLACALDDKGYPAIAVSAGLLERIAKGSDALTRVILLHEIAHLAHYDERRLPRAEALLAVCRKVLGGIALSLAALLTTSAVLDFANVGGGEPPPAGSLSGYVIDSVTAVGFAYSGLVIIARYAGVLTTLVELRADVAAASATGSLKTFVAALGNDSAVRASSWRDRLRSLAGLRITHLSVAERLSLLREPARLLTPKLRYLVLSSLLPVLLVMNGWLTFTSFRWLLSAGLLTTAMACNVLSLSMVANAGRFGQQAIPQRRLLAITIGLILVNLLPQIELFSLTGRTGELLTALFNPTYAESWDQIGRKVLALILVLAAPITEALANGRLLLWIAVTYVGLLATQRLGHGLSIGAALPWLAAVIATATAFGHFQPQAALLAPIAGTMAGLMALMLFRLWTRPDYL